MYLLGRFIHDPALAGMTVMQFPVELLNTTIGSVKYHATADTINIHEKINPNNGTMIDFCFMFCPD